MATSNPSVPVMPVTLLTASQSTDRFSVIGYTSTGRVVGSWSGVHAGRLATATAYFLDHSHEVHVHDYTGKLIDVRKREVL